MLHYKYADKPDDPDFNPKLYVKSGWNPPREDPDLEENLYKIRQELLTNLSDNRPLWKNNLSREERSGLREIKEDPSVRVLATDKNLGPALVSTEWVKQETLKHLNDTKTYSKVTADDWTYRRLKVIETRDKLVNSFSHLAYLKIEEHSPKMFFLVQLQNLLEVIEIFVHAVSLLEFVSKRPVSARSHVPLALAFAAHFACYLKIESLLACYGKKGA